MKMHADGSIFMLNNSSPSAMALFDIFATKGRKKSAGALAYW